MSSLQVSLSGLLACLTDQDVTDVLVNSARDVWLDKRGVLVSTQTWFSSDDQVRLLAKALIELGDNHLDFANPACDVMLGQSELPQLRDLGISWLRVHCVLDAGIARSTAISVRCHRTRNFSLEDYLENSRLPEGQVSLLEQTLTEPKSFVISGPTGCGKTTLLKAMLAKQPNLRTLILEDTPELQPIAGHTLTLSSRPANSEGQGRIQLERLAFEALRMRPDRIVVGEVRGAEIVTLVESLNFGSAQVAFTLHANSAKSVRSRMSSLWLAAKQNEESLERALSQIEIVIVHLRRQGSARCIESIELLK